MSKQKEKYIVKVGELYLSDTKRLYDEYDFKCSPHKTEAKRFIYPTAKHSAELLNGEVIDYDHEKDDSTEESGDSE